MRRSLLRRSWMLQQRSTLRQPSRIPTAATKWSQCEILSLHSAQSGLVDGSKQKGSRKFNIVTFSPRKENLFLHSWMEWFWIPARLCQQHQRWITRSGNIFRLFNPSFQAMVLNMFSGGGTTTSVFAIIVKLWVSSIDTKNKYQIHKKKWIMVKTEGTWLF